LLVLDHKELKMVEPFVARENESQGKPDQPEELAPLRKMQRQVQAIRFADRLGKAANQKESLESDDVVLEVAEAVAKHWLDVRLHYLYVHSSGDGIISDRRVPVLGFCRGCVGLDLSARHDDGGLVRTNGFRLIAKQDQSVPE
jgi:hypothetical protein